MDKHSTLKKDIRDFLDYCKNTNQEIHSEETLNNYTAKRFPSMSVKDRIRHIDMEKLESEWEANKWKG
jgi:hypothetical protein